MLFICYETYINLITCFIIAEYWSYDWYKTIYHQQAINSSWGRDGSRPIGNYLSFKSY